MEKCGNFIFLNNKRLRKPFLKTFVCQFHIKPIQRVNIICRNKDNLSKKIKKGLKLSINKPVISGKKKQIDFSLNFKT